MTPRKRRSGPVGGRAAKVSAKTPTTVTPAEALVLAASAAGGHAVEHTHEPTAWLTARLAEVQRDAVGGRLARCAHARRGRPMFLALSGRRALCRTCARAHALRELGTEADRTCDRCGCVTEADTAAMFPGAVAYGPMIVTFGLCARCSAAERCAS